MAQVSTMLHKLRQNAYFFFLLFTVTQGPLLFGYHLAELNAPSDVITCHRKSIHSTLTTPNLPHCIPMTPLSFGLVQSIFTLGGLLGALVAGPLSSRHGRLLTMRLNTLPMILGPLIATLAPSVPVMALGRFLSGLGAGASLVVVPIYIAEIAPAAQRGFYGSFTQIRTNVGIFIAQVVGYFLSFGAVWRVILGVAGVIAVGRLMALAVAVESPRWLGERGRWREARASLVRLRGGEEGVEEEMKGWGLEGVRKVGGGGDGVEGEADESQGLLEPEVGGDGERGAKDGENNDLSFLEVVTNPRYRRAIVAVMIVMAAQQLTGINSIIMYGVSLLSSLLSSSSALLNIFVSLLNIVATTAFAPLSDHPRLGRKGCLLLSIIGMSISSILLGIAIRASIKVLSAVCVLTFVASFALGLGPVPFMLASELVDTKGVSATQSWALAANWIATFLVAQFFPIVNEKLGKGVTYFLFAGFGALFVVLVSWYVPETRGTKNMAEVWGEEEHRAGHVD